MGDWIGCSSLELGRKANALNLMWVYHNTKLTTFMIKRAVKGVIQYVVHHENKRKCRKKRYETATQACAAKSHHMCRIHSE